MPQGHWGCLETFWLSQLGGRGVLLTSSGWRPGMSLTILQGTGQPHPGARVPRLRACEQPACARPPEHLPPDLRALAWPPQSTRDSSWVTAPAKASLPLSSLGSALAAWIQADTASWAQDPNWPVRLQAWLSAGGWCPLVLPPIRHEPAARSNCWTGECPQVRVYPKPQHGALFGNSTFADVTG